MLCIAPLRSSVASVNPGTAWITSSVEVCHVVHLQPAAAEESTDGTSSQHAIGHAEHRRVLLVQCVRLVLCKGWPRLTKCMTDCCMPTLQENCFMLCGLFFLPFLGGQLVLGPHSAVYYTALAALAVDLITCNAIARMQASGTKYSKHVTGRFTAIDMRYTDTKACIHALCQFTRAASRSRNLLLLQTVQCHRSSPCQAPHMYFKPRGQPNGTGKTQQPATPADTVRTLSQECCQQSKQHQIRSARCTVWPSQAAGFFTAPAICLFAQNLLQAAACWLP
jgi:hypothetical protein